MELALRRTALGRAPVLVLLVAGVVGFLIASQVRTTEPFTARLEAESEGDLARILSRLTTEHDALRDEVANLRLQLLDLETASRRDAAAEEAARQQLDALSVLAATTPVAGPGIRLVITDAKDAVGYDTLLDVVQELRDAGAEAMAVNRVRVGAHTSFAERDRSVTVDGTPVRSPYRIEAIGAPATLEGALEIPGGVIDTLRSLPQVTIEARRHARLDLPALRRAPSFRVARPVGSAP